jgi:hypothetical protein
MSTNEDVGNTSHDNNMKNNGGENTVTTNDNQHHQQQNPDIVTTAMPPNAAPINGNFIVGPDGFLYARIDPTNNMIPPLHQQDQPQYQHSTTNPITYQPPQQPQQPTQQQQAAYYFSPATVMQMPIAAAAAAGTSFPGTHMSGGLYPSNTTTTMPPMINVQQQQLQQPPPDSTAGVIPGYMNSDGKRKEDEMVAGDSNKRLKLDPGQHQPQHQPQHIAIQPQQQLPPPTHQQMMTNQVAVVPGRSYPLFVDNDERNLSHYQCLARKQIEVFEATPDDAQSNRQGRNKQIIVGQVGVRCRHCYKLPPKQRKTGSVYYPNKVRSNQHGVSDQAYLVFVVVSNLILLPLSHFSLSLPVCTCILFFCTNKKKIFKKK